MTHTTIAVNGRTVAVLNTLSSGPGCAPHTFELVGGAYVYVIAGTWWFQERGQVKRPVTVTTSPEDGGEMSDADRQVQADEAGEIVSLPSRGGRFTRADAFPSR